jgi:hypothetical protein
MREEGALLQAVDREILIPHFDPYLDRVAAMNTMPRPVAPC